MNEVNEVNEMNEVNEAEEVNEVKEAEEVNEVKEAEEVNEVNEENEANEVIEEKEENKVNYEIGAISATHKKKIVAVDDSNMVLKTLKNVLAEDYELHAFSAGTRALEYLEQKDKMPDLIILDIEMPIMNGYEVLKRIRKIFHLRCVPVIFLTSHNEKKQVMKAVTDGAKDYVVKPIDKDVLMKKLHILLNE